MVVRDRLCSPDIELLSISLRPHYLPREFPQLLFTLVYIHPRANATAACQMIADVTHRLDAISPDAPKFILGDFNHCNISSVQSPNPLYGVVEATLMTFEQSSSIDLYPL